MRNTLLLYKEEQYTAQRVAEYLGYVIGNTKVVACERLQADWKNYENVVFVMNFEEKNFLEESTESLRAIHNHIHKKRVAILGYGVSKDEFIHKVRVFVEDMSLEKERIYFLEDEFNLDEVASIGQEMIQYFKVVQKPMSRKALKEVIHDFIGQHNMIALATGCGSYVRCSPVEYIYHDEKFYIITEGGCKFRGLIQNEHISAGIYDPYKDMKTLAGLQITGQAKLIPSGTDIYNEIMKVRGVPEKALKQLAVELYMVEITPTKYELLYSPLVEQGYDSKQIFEE